MSSSRSVCEAKEESAADWPSCQLDENEEKIETSSEGAAKDESGVTSVREASWEADMIGGVAAGAIRRCVWELDGDKRHYY